MTKVIQPSSQDSYWLEVFSSAAAYERIGLEVLGAVPFGESDRQTALKRFAANFEGIGPLIDQLQVPVTKKLLDPTLRDRAANVAAIDLSISEFIKLGSAGILDTVVRLSDDSVSNIASFLAHADTPPDFYHIANALLVAITAFRAATFFLFDRPKNDIDATVCADLRKSLGDRSRGLENARTVGRNRVSEVGEELVLLDELGPVWGTNFTITVDGRLVYSDTFAGSRGIPRRTVTEVRQTAEAMRDSLRQSNANVVAAELKKSYDACDVVSGLVCH
jgi:hypothetical protein